VNNDMQAGDNCGSPGDRSDGDLGQDEPDFPPIPEELKYLVEPAIQYGRRYQFDDAVKRFLENAEESDFEIFAALAERARLSCDYPRFLQWSDEVDEVVDRIVDDRYPYTMDISEQQRKDFLRLINPDMVDRFREGRLRQFLEVDDHSEVAERRRDMRARKLTEANDKVHHMDIYFLFGLMDACDMAFEPE